jgi:hypothetical protein
MKIGSLTDLSNLDRSNAPKRKDHDSDSEIKETKIIKRKQSSSDEDLTYQKISDYYLETSLDSTSSLKSEVLLPKHKHPSSNEISSNFSIKKNFNDLDTSFFSNTQAILFKKMSVYRRNKLGCFYEICLPLFMIMVGITFGMIINDNRSSPKSVMDA